MGNHLKRMVSTTAVAILLAGGGSPGLFAAQQPATWLGGSGNWTDATKWSGGVVPNNNATDTYNVNIDGGNPVSSSATLRGSVVPPTYTIDSLAIDSGDSLTLNLDVNLQLNQSLTVNGTINVVSGTARLPIDAAISGAGEVVLSNPLGLIASGGTLTVEPTMTIRGRGAAFSPSNAAGLGSAGVILLNKGRIHVDDFYALRISGSSIDNQGIIEVGQSGTLIIDADFNLATFGNLVRHPIAAMVAVTKTQNNAGQTLNISNDWGWQITGGGTITGGTIATMGPGSLAVGVWSSSGTLDNVTLNGLCKVYGSLDVTGTFAGNGTIQITEPDTPETMGVIHVQTVPAGITIRGGIDQSHDDPQKAKIFLTTNNGTIRAETSGYNGNANLRLSGAVTNTGALEIANGSTMLTDNALTFGTNGKLVIDGGGLLSVTGNLILSTTFDSLDVRPRLDGQPYASQTIATYTGTRSGTFNTVTPGISVQYLTGQIRISGTPVPEPAAIGLSMMMLAGLACRRRRRLGG